MQKSDHFYQKERSKHIQKIYSDDEKNFFDALLLGAHDRHISSQTLMDIRITRQAC